MPPNHSSHARPPAPPASAPPRRQAAGRTDRRWGPREFSLVILATIATLAAAHYAADFLVPVIGGVLLAYALEPLVARLARGWMPRGVAATLVLATIVAAVAGAAWWLRHDAVAVAAELPHAARKLRLAVQSDPRPSPIAHVREAAAELERAAAEATGKPEASTAPASPPAQTELSAQLAEHGAPVLKVAGQLAIAATLALFLLAAGDLFRRKLVRLVGPSLSRRRITVEILDEIDLQVQRYLGVMLVTNVAIALLCLGAFVVAGLHRAAFWAALTGVLHFIPYIGSVLALVLVASAALIETGSVATAAYVVAATFLIFIVMGMGFNTWLQGRACRMNPVALFIFLLLFGWLWGVWGLLLGAPMAAVAKTIADRVEVLRPFGDLLGELAPRSSAVAQATPPAHRT